MGVYISWHIIILTRAIRLTVMKKQRECANRDEENILSALAKALVVFLLLVIDIGCRSTDKHIPLSADLAIAQADIYRTRYISPTFHR